MKLDYMIFPPWEAPSQLETPVEICEMSLRGWYSDHVVGIRISQGNNPGISIPGEVPSGYVKIAMENHHL